eukprot:IDg17677t1
MRLHRDVVVRYDDTACTRALRTVALRKASQTSPLMDELTRHLAGRHGVSLDVHSDGDAQSVSGGCACTAPMLTKDCSWLRGRDSFVAQTCFACFSCRLPRVSHHLHVSHAAFVRLRQYPISLAAVIKMLHLTITSQYRSVCEKLLGQTATVCLRAGYRYSATLTAAIQNAPSGHHTAHARPIADYRCKKRGIPGAKPQIKSRFAHISPKQMQEPSRPHQNNAGFDTDRAAQYGDVLTAHGWNLGNRSHVWDVAH